MQKKNILIFLEHPNKHVDHNAIYHHHPYTTENHHVEPKVMEVWKMVFRVQTGDFQVPAVTPEN